MLLEYQSEGQCITNNNGLSFTELYYCLSQDFRYVIFMLRYKEIKF